MKNTKNQTKMNVERMEYIKNNGNLNLSDHELKILKELDKRQNGSYFCLAFETDVSKYLRASARNLNVKKLTFTSARKGITRANTKSYTPTEKTREPWFHHIDKTLIKHNKADKLYVMLFPNKGKPETRYQVNGKTVTKEELKEMDILIPSYFNKHIEDVYTIELKNILEVYNRKH